MGLWILEKNLGSLTAIPQAMVRVCPMPEQPRPCFGARGLWTIRAQPKTFGARALPTYWEPTDQSEVGHRTLT